MAPEVPRLVLASGSPRRHALFALSGLAFEVVVPDVDESWFDGERPGTYVARVARSKADAVAGRLADGGGPDAAETAAVVIAADTTVELDGAVLGKPDDEAHARVMLTSLSGRTHLVHTAVVVMAVAPGAGTSVERVHPAGSRVVTTEVQFDVLDQRLIEWYVATGEPADKAGAYAIQGRGAILVRAVRGSVSNVVGLPLAELRELLVAAGVPAAS